MPRKRGKKKFDKKNEPDYDSDDPNTYKSMPRPDQESSDYYNDAVDEFNSRRDKIALERGVDPAESSSDNEEEVLGLDDSDSDDLEEKMQIVKRNRHLEEIASDLEEDGEEGEDEEMPDAKAWGQKKKDFFHTDYVDDDLPGVSGSEEEAAREEEEREALAIQQRMAETLDEGDFGLDLFKPKPIQKVQEIEEEEKVTLDLSKLSKREKLQILKKESPEFLELVEDFKAKMNEVIERLHPLYKMVKDGQIPEGPGAVYVKTKYQLCLGYCVNISFYMVLKARHTPVHNHPIIGRILQYRKLLSELEPVDTKFADEIQSLLEDDVSGDEETSLLEDDVSDEETSKTKEKELAEERKPGKQKNADSSTSSSKRKVSPLLDADEIGEPKHKTRRKKTKETKKPKKGSNDQTGLTTEEQKALEYYEAMAKKLQDRRADKDKELRELYGEQEEGGEDEGNLNEEEETVDKRGISYQISKNKGLTARKRKELRNPRVKHRMKFKKAKVRRKGQVRDVRKELKRYDGEISGIRAGVIKSVKIK